MRSLPRGPAARLHVSQRQMSGRGRRRRLPARLTLPGRPSTARAGGGAVRPPGRRDRDGARAGCAGRGHHRVGRVGRAPSHHPGDGAPAGAVLAQAPSPLPAVRRAAVARGGYPPCGGRMTGTRRLRPRSGAGRGQGRWPGCQRARRLVAASGRSSRPCGRRSPRRRADSRAAASPAAPGRALRAGARRPRWSAGSRSSAGVHLNSAWARPRPR